MTRLRWRWPRSGGSPRRPSPSSSPTRPFTWMGAARCWNWPGSCATDEPYRGDEFLRAAHELAGRGPRLIVVGGELRRLSQTLVGPLTRRLLEGLHLDKAFMGTMGFALKEGLTTTDAGEAFTKELVLGQARQAILLADSSKAGKVAFARAGAWQSIQVLITDDRLDKSFGRELTNLGINLIRV